MKPQWRRDQGRLREDDWDDGGMDVDEKPEATPAPVTVSAPHDDFVHEHAHRLCGLFHETRVNVRRNCPGCSRRDYVRETREQLTILKSQLRHSRHMTVEARKELEAQVADIENANDWQEALGECLFPFVEDEEWMNDDFERSSNIGKWR